MATRITLVHNSEAGFKPYPKEELISALEQKGFKVRYCDYKAEDYAASLQDPGAAVVVGGGDGTVVKVVRLLIGKGVPIGLLPLGTANNIATSLGIRGKPSDIIAGWDLSNRKDVDLGIVEKGGDTPFLECLSFGVMARLIRKHSKDNTDSSSQEEELALARRHLLEIMKHYPAQEGSIRLDGKSYSGRYILMQIMNTGYAGPRIALAPTADPGDGQLEVVLVREEERQQLVDYLTDYRDKQTDVPFFVQSAKSIQLEWHGRHFHDGDEMHEEEPPFKLNIHLKPKQLQFLQNRS